MNIEKLKRVLVSTATGQQIPITQLADIRMALGSRHDSERERSFIGFNVYVDMADATSEAYVADAKKDRSQGT